MGVHGDLLRFRRMTLDDLPAVLAIERQAFPKPWSEASFRRECSLSWSKIEVVTEERIAGVRVIGYACTWRVADELHVMNVAVHPARRRRGVGRRLVDRALSDAVACGATAAVLEVRSSNAGARRLYADVGFRQVGLRRSYYGPGQDALVLQRLLDRVS